MTSAAKAANATPCVPGQILSTTQSHTPGAGTHVYENNILASILGNTLIIPSSNKSSKPTISVPRQPPSSAASTTTENDTVLPKVGSTVLCRVTRVRQRELNASILTVVSPTAKAPTAAMLTTYAELTSDDIQHQCILRREDIRTHVDAATLLTNSFRVGDIILAQVISLGDERNYYVSTAGNEFGVVVATSDSGNAMVPVSWREMKDVVTGKGEGRKVAKPN